MSTGMTYRRMDQLVLEGDAMFQNMMHKIQVGMLGKRFTAMSEMNDMNPLGAMVNPEVLLEEEQEVEDGTE